MCAQEDWAAIYAAHDVAEVLYHTARHDLRLPTPLSSAALPRFSAYSSPDRSRMISLWRNPTSIYSDPHGSRMISLWRNPTSIYSDPHGARMISLWRNPTVLASSTDALALNLGPGSGGGTPAPVGWQAVGFDDRTWGGAVGATVDGTHQPVPGSGAIWSSAAATVSDCLFRHRFTVPAPVVSASITVTGDDSLAGVWLNGTFIGSTTLLMTGLETATFAVPTSLLILGGTNVLAVRGTNQVPVLGFVSYLLTVS